LVVVFARPAVPVSLVSLVPLAGVSALTVASPSGRCLLAGFCLLALRLRCACLIIIDAGMEGAAITTAKANPVGAMVANVIP
jgi:hypothetical protein